MRARVQQLAHLGLRIVQISEVHAVRGADGNAGRIEAALDAVDAEGTFVGIAVRMDEACVIWARRQTGFTADTFIVGHQHHAARLMHVAGAGRAAGDAGRIVTVIASLRTDLHLQRGKRAVDLFRDPVTAIALGNAIFGFAGHHSVVTTHTSPRIDNHGETGHRQTSVSRVTKFTFIPVPPINGSVL